MIRSGNNKQGFTIVELLIVIVVIAILAAITIVAYNGIRQRAVESATNAELQQAAKSLEARKLTNNETYPADWTAAKAAGVKLSNESSVLYYSNGVSYCLQTTANSKSYYVTSTNTVIATGICTPSGTVTWLPLNGNANDFVAPSNTVTVTDAVLGAGRNGAANGAYEFSTTTQRIDSALQFPTTSTQPFTVSVWTKGVPAQSNEWAYIARRGVGNDVGSSVWIMAINTDLQYALSANGAWSTTLTGVYASASSLAHLVLTYDGQFQRSYVNGVLRVTSDVGPITRTLAGGTVSLGTTNTTRPLNGSIDDFRLFNRTLSAQEVTDLYTAGAY